MRLVRWQVARGSLLSTPGCCWKPHGGWQSCAGRGATSHPSIARIGTDADQIVFRDRAGRPDGITLRGV